MKYDEAFEHIDDYIDGKLDATRRDAFEACLADSEELRSELDAVTDLKRLVNELPSSIEPAHDLWPRIHAEIDRSARTVDFGGRRARRPLFSTMRYAMAAAAILLLVLGLRAMVDFENGSDTPLVAQDPELTRVEEEFAKAKDDLVRVLRERQGNFDPNTLAVVVENLSIIDGAIQEINLALVDNPEDLDLVRMLHAAYRSEVDLLHQVVNLADES